MQNGTFDRWFRIWLTLLEQAIVLAKISAATGRTIDVLCSLEVQALARGVLTIGTENHQLPGDLSAMLTDYRAEVLKQCRQDGEQQGVPLFPCPFARTGNRAVVAIRPERFDPLGKGWIDVAGRYPSGGLPGEHLGEQRIKQADVEWRRFRHTYLQHLADAGTDIFLVQELADHSNVGTTMRSYVTTRIEQLTDAVEQLSQWRINRFGEPARADVALLPTSSDVITNTCSNPQVLRFNKEGCDRGRLCYSCPHFSADPSHLDDVKAEVLTLRKALARFETEGDELRAQVAEQDLAGWTGVRQRIEGLLAAMSAVERQEVLEASRIVRACRTHARSGSVTLGMPGLPRESSND